MDGSSLSSMLCCLCCLLHSHVQSVPSRPGSDSLSLVCRKAGPDLPSQGQETVPGDLLSLSSWKTLRHLVVTAGRSGQGTCRGLGAHAVVKDSFFSFFFF